MASKSEEEGELPTSSDEDSGSSDDEQSESTTEAPLKFKNDGSFLEMFKKMQDKQKVSTPEPTQPAKAAKTEENPSPSSNAETTSPSQAEKVQVTKPVGEKKPGLLSIVGKRRGGRVLPTGMVKKQKRPEEEEEENGGKKDAWSQYMSEVKKYKERLGDEEDKNRPLVK